MNAGIPIIAELSKVMKVSQQDVKEMVSQGKIGFTEIQKVFENMTNAGGLFHNMMEGQSKTLAGQWSNLQDNLEQMFNELGKSSEGMFSNAISGANYLIENYQKVGKVIGSLIDIYGTYRTAMALNLIVTQGMAVASQKDAVAKGIQTLAINKQTIAQIKLNLAMMANPYVIVGVAIAGLAAALWLAYDGTTAVEKATNRLNAEKEEIIKQEQKHKEKIEDLISTATNQALADADRLQALIALKTEYPNIFAQYDLENLKLADILQLKQKIAEEDGRRKSVQNQKTYDQYKTDYEEFSKGIKKSKYKNEKGSFDINTKVNEALEKELKEEFGGNWRFKWTEVEQYLKKKVQEGKKSIKGDRVTAWQKELEGQSVEDLEAQINERKRLIHKIEKRKDKDQWATEGVQMQGEWFAFDDKELQAQISLMENQIAKIKAPKKSYLEWEKQYRDELAQAKKEALEVSKNTIGFSDAEMKKKIEEAEAKVKVKQKQLDDHLLIKEKSNKGKSSKSEKDFDNIAYNRETERKKFDDEILAQKNNINQMQEGYAKELALIDLHYREKAEAIRRGQEDAILALEKDKKDSKGKMTDETYTARKTQIIENQIISNTANDQAKAQQEKKIFDDLLGKYQHYDQKRREIEQKFTDEKQIFLNKIKELEAKNSEGIYTNEIENIKKALSEAQKLKEQQISELELKQSDKHILGEMFSDISNKTADEIQKINDRVQEFLALLTAPHKVEITIEEQQKFGISQDTFSTLKNDASQMDSLTKKGKEIQNVATESKGVFHSLGASIKEALDAKNTQQFQEAMGKVQNKFQAISGMANLFASALKNLGNATGNTGLSALGEELSGLMDVMGSVMSGVQAGAAFGPVGAVVGGVLSGVSAIASKVAEVNKKHEEAMKKIKESEINYQRTINDLLFKEQMLMKDKKSVFGTKEISSAMSYLSLYAENFNKLKSSISDVKESWEDLGKQSENSFKRAIEKNGKLQLKGNAPWALQLKTFQTDLEKIQIKTGSETSGWGFWKKQHDVYKSIVDVYPDLINGQGEFNRQQAQTILQTREFREGEKEQLQEIINQYDRMKEAETQFNDYLQSTFGSMGSSMMDSVINSLKTGEDAFESFAKSVGDIIGNLAKQIAYEIFLADEFKAFQERIKKGVEEIQSKNYERKGGRRNATLHLISEEEKAKRVAEYMKNQTAQFAETMKGKIGAMQDFITDFNQSTAAMGYDFLGETRQAQEKGFARMSQDTADELHGQFRLLTQLSAESKTAILQVSKDVSDSYKFMQTHSAQQLKHLAGIEANTFTLHAMKTDLSAMKSTLADLEVKGIKIRS